MTGYVVLLTVELLLLWVAYKVLRDILSPAFISIFTFLCSTLLCLPMVSAWNMVVHEETVAVVALGLSCMVLACRLNRKPGASRTRPGFTEVQPVSGEAKRGNGGSASPTLIYISVSPVKSGCLIVVCILLTFYYIQAIVKAGLFVGSTGGLMATTALRMADDVEIDFMARQGTKFVFGLAYVHLYLFVNNVLSKSRVGKELYHLVPPVCLFLCCIFAGVRTDMLKLISAGVFMTVLLMRYGNRKLGKFFRNISVGLVLFAFASARLNTINKGEDAYINRAYSTGQIVAFYIGSPMQVLNMKIENGIEKYRDKKIWGRTTFGRLYFDAKKLGFYETKIGDEIGNIFVMLDGRNNVTANVDTILGAPLMDFGVSGMLLFIFLLYWGLNRIYHDKVLRVVGDRRKSPTNVILYSFFVVIPVMAYYACLPSLVFTFFYFMQVLIIYAVCKFYFRKYGASLVRTRFA